jgi:hypothetical protein
METATDKISFLSIEVKKIITNVNKDISAMYKVFSQDTRCLQSLKTVSER